MAREQEFEGRSLEEALAAAAEATGVPEHDLHYRIEEQGRRGLFGIGAKSVRILVETPGDSPKPARGPEPARTPAARPEASASDATGVEAVMQRMLDLMDLDLKVRAAAIDGGLELVLTGPDRSMLNQRDSELRSALQFLINRMARRAWPDIGRIRLAGGAGGAGGGPRSRRDDDVVAEIREVAAKVAKTGKQHRLPPMNAYERRIVHLTVREFDGLASRSDGEGHLKRVAIFKRSES